MDEAHSTLSPSGGLSEVVHSEIPQGNLSPLKERGRYELGATSLGRLERLAKADVYFNIYDKVREEFGQEPKKVGFNDPDLFQKFTEDQLRTIAQSVIASSEIEGEHYKAEALDIYVSALTKETGRLEAELADRHATFKDQIETYLWLLESGSDTPLSVELIQSIHQKMFRNHPKISHHAGELKRAEVEIKYKDASGITRIIKTIPQELTEEYLEVACDLFNRNYLASKNHAQYSTLVAAAEFHCDYLAIHPFSDGNGRTARLISAYLLHRAGYKFTYLYPFDQIVLDRRRDYYRALYQAQQGWHTEEEDFTPWVRFYISAVFEQFERAIRRVRDANETS